MATAVPAWRSPDLPIRIGVSSCLLGEEVRYDGGHQRDDYVVGVLGRACTLVPVCPELEVGLGVPREPIRLVGEAATPRLLGVTSGTDHTEAMRDFARRRIAALRRQGLSGYVLKRGSPSCGLARVKRYAAADAAPTRDGTGLFARALTKALPRLPVEEEGRLTDAALRDSFITRVFAYRRLTAWRESAPGAGAVVEFHAAHTYLLLAHRPSAHARLGRLVARVPPAPAEVWLDRYGAIFMAALRTRPTVGKHVNVLRHITGSFARRLGPSEKRELQGLIGDYARGRVPQVVPITLINHFVARFDVTDARDQVYLHPHPKELMLRNHV
jgi:uncharacterized protein YbbK (DUF523 family)/uncharacterized protein YbgA (DUF1722 family)